MKNGNDSGSEQSGKHLLGQTFFEDSPRVSDVGSGGEEDI